jgi:Fe2+ or Zn2+ uptake regulation protein
VATPESEKIEAALRDAGEPLTVDDICRRVWKRVGERERNLVRVNLHRLDERGRIQRFALRYKLKR